MTVVVIIALVAAFVVYIVVGLSLGRRATGIGDLLPLAMSKQACVKNSFEFSASTVATTISLATVVMAFFELAGVIGIWLFWTVITTSSGLLVVRLFAKRIWERISEYDHRPTLHEFLGREFGSDAVRYVGAVCTSLGFLAAFAVELTVGSRFFAWLVPGVPAWVVVIVLSVVALFYTAMGGFRAVIVTDRIQMISIRLLLLALPAFYIYYAATHGGWGDNIAKIPPRLLSFSYSGALIPFMIGVFVINVPTFISDMSIWQRIAGSQKNQTVTGGLWGSVFSSAVTWGIFAVLAILAFMMVEHSQKQNVNPLVSVLRVVSEAKGPFGVLVLFFSVLGLYGAMLSTASTQLIAASHTIYEDIFSQHIRKQSLRQRLESRGELNIPRVVLVLVAVLSTILVEVLARVGFSIVDLVFAIYGPQVGLCPLVICALMWKREHLQNMSFWAASAVSVGFIAGWGTAVYSVFTKNAGFVYLAPVSSLVISSLLLICGIFAGRLKTRDLI